MMNNIRTGMLTLCVSSLIACDSNQSTETNTIEGEYVGVEQASVEYDNAEYYPDEAYHDPYMDFCLQGSRLDVDPNTLKGDDCIFRTEGRLRGDMTDPNATAFIARVSDFPALENAGIDSFGIDIKVGQQAPKISEGVYSVIPYSILSTENKKLPRVMVHLSPIYGNSPFAAMMSPDVEKFKSSVFAKPEDYPPYEILSATLTITHVEDIPLSDDEKETQKLMKEAGMLTGQQYVKGTFTFAVKKFGPDGSDFGPETFTFGSRSDWSYYPNLRE